MTIARAFAALLAAVVFVVPASAQTTFDLINEYPANSITGEADAFFADAVQRRSEGRIVVRPLSDAKSGVRTRDQLKAVRDGKFAMADSFAGAARGHAWPGSGWQNWLTTLPKPRILHPWPSVRFVVKHPR